MRSLIRSALLSLVFELGVVVAQFDNSPDFIQTTQIQAPPLAAIPDNACTVRLMQHSFVNSWGQPSVTQYTGPPAECPGPWSNVLLRLEIISQGVQYDRLGTAWLDNHILWEFSGAEPSIKQGVYQSSYRETVDYSSLWKSARTVTVDIGNTVNEQYTAPLNATLTAIFVPGKPADRVADAIVPLQPKAAFWNIPKESAVHPVGMPTRSIEKATVEIFTSGNGQEEFWWGNTLDGYELTFNSSGVELLGRGPFREVQILIDGKVAGVVWPFSTIYTGGIVPGLWRPLASINAYDLPSFTISLDPWLPILADGKQHTYELRALAGHNKITLENWFAAANVKLWTSLSGKPTTGRMTYYSAPAAASISSSASIKGKNETLTQKVTASRRISITSEVILPGSRGYSTTRKWEQSMIYSNYQVVSNSGNTQYLTQSTKGSDSTQDGEVFSYSYPMEVNSTFTATENVTSIYGEIDKGYIWRATKAFSPFYVEGRMDTRQKGVATYLKEKGKPSISPGNTTQTFRFEGSGKGTGVRSYTRDVTVELGKYIQDTEVLNGKPVKHAEGIEQQLGKRQRSIGQETLGNIKAATDFAPAIIGRMPRTSKVGEIGAN